MGYIDYSYYKSLYGDQAIKETDFNRLSWDASRKLDAATTGVDGVRKLSAAFPKDEYDAEAVKRCACKLIYLSYKMEDAERVMSQGRGYTETENGLRGKIISSVSAGNESISYATGNSSSAATLIDKALADKAVQDKLFQDTIREYLSGIADANSVNLLYMGRYPAVVKSHV